MRYSKLQVCQCNNENWNANEISCVNVGHNQLSNKLVAKATKFAIDYTE